MNTALLRTLVEYAACGSAQHAAERLGVSRSSVTRSIKRLEEELNTQLFVSSVNGVIPTHTGNICLRYAGEILRHEEDLQFDFTGENIYSGTVDIGMGVTRARQILPAMLPEFNRRYPNISVQLHELSTSELTYALLNRQMDLAIMSRPAGINGIVFEPMRWDRLVLVAPQDDTFVEEHCKIVNGEKCISIADFRDKPFILGYPDQKSRAECEPLFRKAQYEPQIVFQTRDSYTASILANNGLAYAIVPENCAIGGNYEIPHYHMEPGSDFGWEVGIAARDGGGLSRAAEQFKKLMLEIVAGQK